MEEELAGRQEPTQVGQALRSLGIQPIFALSPQAKGRIERLFGTLQDRLGAELGLAKVTTLAQANDFLPPFIRRFDRLAAMGRPIPVVFITAANGVEVTHRTTGVEVLHKPFDGEILLDAIARAIEGRKTK